jgi:hypothetical protein
MMLQAIALAIICFEFETLMKQFIRLVLEEFSLVGITAEQSIARQLLPRAGPFRERPQRTVE